MPGPVYLLRDGQGRARGPVNALHAPLDLFANITPQVNRLEPRGEGETSQIAVATVYNNGDNPVTVKFGKVELSILAHGEAIMEAPAHTKIVKVLIDGNWCDLTEFPVASYCD
ncbi:MAG TPA: hypothetical protein VFT64_04545 [Rickettsiales bacterium]|nr:hypothetical protein [Rickettsiales bacterium]